MFKFLILLCFTISISMASPLSIQKEWSSVSDPLIMGKNFQTRFAELPAQAHISETKRFWSGDYWPLNKGIINNRWNASTMKDSESPDKIKVRSMSQQELAQLSPSEKFDLLNGRYDYPLKNEVQSYVHYGAKKWEGICHGWAPASMNHKEPSPKVLANPDGILIPFGSSDIKAVLSYFYAYPYQVEDTHQMGRRCERGMMNFARNCKQDLNAGAFHIVLANRVGIQQLGFIADMDRYKEIWNHPIVGYKTIITDTKRAPRSSAPGSVKLIKVKTIVSFTDEAKNSWEPVIGTAQQKVKTLEIKYSLDLDINGQIIGGEWRSMERPDFLWIKERPAQFTGDYVRLAELLND